MLALALVDGTITDHISLGVCKEEKATRDECLLFSETGPEKCADHITAYKKCMAGFGFNI